MADDPFRSDPFSDIIPPLARTTVEGTDHSVACLYERLETDHSVASPTSSPSHAESAERSAPLFPCDTRSGPRPPHECSGVCAAVHPVASEAGSGVFMTGPPPQPRTEDRGAIDGPELIGVETGTRTVHPGQKGHRRAASEERGTSDSENERFCTIYSHNEPLVLRHAERPSRECYKITG